MSIDKFVPKVLIKNTNQPKWFNSTIRHKTKVLRMLKRRMNRSPTPSDHLINKVKILESDFQAELLKTKSEYESSLICHFTSSRDRSSKVYKYIKSLKKNHSLPTTMHCNDHNHSTAKLTFSTHSSNLFTFARVKVLTSLQAI